MHRRGTPTRVNSENSTCATLRGHLSYSWVLVSLSSASIEHWLLQDTVPFYLCYCVSKSFLKRNCLPTYPVIRNFSEVRCRTFNRQINSCRNRTQRRFDAVWYSLCATTIASPSLTVATLAINRAISFTTRPRPLYLLLSCTEGVVEARESRI